MYTYEYDRDRNNVFLVADEATVGVKKHFHNCMEFIYVLESGDAVAHIDGEVYRLASGQVCAVSCFSTHYYEQSRPGKYIVCLVPAVIFVSRSPCSMSAASGTRSLTMRAISRSSTCSKC